MKLNATKMGMPVVINIPNEIVSKKDIEEILFYFDYIDEKFSTYKKDSEIMKINKGKIQKKNYSEDMKLIFKLAEKTKKETNGYFDIVRNGSIDPSGIVKGFAIFEAAKKLKEKGYKNFYIEIAGDIQVYGKNEKGKNWQIGIENPFDRKEIVKVTQLTNKGIATSGTYVRGKHIYNPFTKKHADDIASITVIGPNIYEADRFATAAFAMGEKGIDFIESLRNFEGYMITKSKRALFTSGFEKYV